MTEHEAKYVLILTRLRPDQKRDLEALAKLESIHGIQSYIRRSIDLFLPTHPLWRTIHHDGSQADQEAA